MRLCKCVFLYVLLPVITAACATWYCLNWYFGPLDLEKTSIDPVTLSEKQFDIELINSEIDRLEISLEEIIAYFESLNFQPKPLAEMKTPVTRSDNARSDIGKMFADLTRPSGISAEELDRHLEGTKLENYGQYFVAAENLYHVNALFLCSLAIHESSWGASRIARDKNNLFGFGAYDGSAYESAVTFESAEKGIIHVAGHVSHHYLTPGGKYYSGASIHHVNRRYASDQEWAAKISRTAVRFLQ